MVERLNIKKERGPYGLFFLHRIFWAPTSRRKIIFIFHVEIRWRRPLEIQSRKEGKGHAVSYVKNGEKKTTLLSLHTYYYYLLFPADWESFRATQSKIKDIFKKFHLVVGVVLLRRHRHFPHQLPVYPLKTRARAKLVHLFSQKTHTHTSLVKEAEKGTRHKFRYSLFCDARFLTRCRKEAVCLYDAILFFSLILNQCPRFF